MKQKRYVIVVTETVQGSFAITASSQQEAINTAHALYRSGDLVLEPSELRKVAFRAFPVAMAELKSPQTQTRAATSFNDFYVNDYQISC